MVAIAIIVGVVIFAGGITVGTVAVVTWASTGKSEIFR